MPHARPLYQATLALLALAFLAAPMVEARIRLITLPPRERVEIQLDHDNATLVEEERIVPLIEGVNQIDFAWAGTRIDPGTIVFRVLGPADGDDLDATVLSVSYPPGENALVWHVAATAAGSVRVRISYLLGRLDRSFNYRAVAEHDEQSLTLAQYVRVQNLAGETFGDSEIHVGVGDTFTRPIGLNETREMLIERYVNVPVRKTYTADLATFGYLHEQRQQLRVPMHYILTNNADHNLGREPLPPGKVRIFQKDRPDADATTAFLGEDWGEFTPIDDEMALYLGVAQDVAVRRNIIKREREQVTGNLSHFQVVVRYEIENFKDEPVTLRVAEDIEKLAQEVGLNSSQPREWVIDAATTFDDEPLADESSHERVMFEAELSARAGDQAEKVVHELHLTFRNEWELPVRPLPRR
ncbi:hypothetical protein ACERK3_02065 [Phycisphaerales bacterium AB-hyl4]|uniref:DUF4139 domain-containing protein n=1 Tax=Natronomicrosphaera hydrolytica TaxID=3242702 RepID=A0ABV4U2R3_9BACT